MKKLLLSICFLLISTLSASADTIVATSLSNFSTANPSSQFAVKIEEAFTVENSRTFQANTIFYGKVTKVVNGQIGKRAGYFEFTPTHYTTNGQTFEVYKKNIPVKVTYYKPFDKNVAAKSLAATGITTIAGHYIPFFSQGKSFVEGAIIQPEDGTNRLVSGVKKVYKDSPLSYVEKGEALTVQVGQQVKLSVDFDAAE